MQNLFLLQLAFFFIFLFVQSIFVIQRQGKGDFQKNVPKKTSTKAKMGTKLILKI